MHLTYTIIGAGVVGLAIARAISDNLKRGESVLVVEKEGSFGRGISSRNSEVVHSGIYYPNGSLKHRLCIRGRKMLYEYCNSRGVAYSKCGKLIIATDETEVDELARLYQNAQINGVENVQMLDRQEALKLESEINVLQAIYSAETGIIDSHGLMKSLVNEITDNEPMIVYRSAVNSIEYKKSNYALGLTDGTRFSSDCVINAAGLGAIEISEAAGIAAEKLYPCKGTYFAYSGRHSFTHLLYPIPNKEHSWLGVHATLDLTGRLRFGPDIEYVASFDDFSVDESKKDSFYAAASKLIKNLEYDQFYPDSAGIRPKIQGPHDSAFKDFYIQEESGRGLPGFINLLGIESPGLTSALAIGEYVDKLVLNIH